MTKYKWNISIKDGNRIAYNTIIDILLTENNCKIDALIDKLIENTKSIIIKNYKKRKNIIFFLRINHGSIKDFIKKQPDLEIDMDNIISYNDPDLYEWEYV